MSKRKTLPKRLAFAAAILAAACHRGDQIAPEGATIVLAANPATIPLNGGTGSALIVATVSSASGVPLPDQDVRFTSTAGDLFLPNTTVSAANVPIRTNGFGNAEVRLQTTVTTTVAARSGKATASLTLNTVNGNLSQITLDLCPGSTTDINNCSDSVCLVARASDNQNLGIGGVVIVFDLQNNTSPDGNKFEGTFSPPTPTTADITGETTQVTFRPSATCSSQCTGGKVCQGEIIAHDLSGNFLSPPLTLLINIQ